MSIKKLSSATAALAFMATSAFAGNLPTDFRTLDTDANGAVTFAEYQKYSQAIGLSSTQAAQDFIRAAQGDAVLTAEELSLALAFEDQPYALQGFTVPADVSSEPLALPVATTVEDSPVMAFEPITVETPPADTEVIIVEPELTQQEVLDAAPVEPELIEDNVSETPQITETPMEDVMGEVETYTPKSHSKVPLTGDTITEEPLETPAEEGFEDIVEDDPS